MNILRLLLLFFVGLFVRRLFSRSTGTSRTSPNAKAKSDSFGSTEQKSNNAGSSGNKITEQEIDDADFEEIP